VQTLAAEFPQASNARREIKGTMEVTATTIKSTLLKEIHTLENLGAQSLTTEIYRTWLTKTTERYEKWFSRL
jgi:hypothetical protein